METDSRTKLIKNLFSLWQLTRSESNNLLGLPESSPFDINKDSIIDLNPDSASDLNERIGYLLDCHQALGLLFPENPNMKYNWVRFNNRDLDGGSPLEIMTHHGIDGIKLVNHFLNFTLQR